MNQPRIQLPAKAKNPNSYSFLRKTNDVYSYPQFQSNESMKISAGQRIRQESKQDQDNYSLIYNKNPFIKNFKMDPRDNKVLIEFILMQQLTSEFNLNDKRIVRRWMSQVYQVVSGDSFMRYFQGQLSMDQTKSFATKNFLLNLHQFMLKIKKNHLRQKKLQIFSFINQQSKKIIGFLKDKFPQTLQVGSNQMLTKIVAKINYSSQIEYDLLFQNRQTDNSQPRIVIQYKDNKNYNSDIMKVLNYLLQIAKMQCKFEPSMQQQLTKTMVHIVLNQPKKEKDAMFQDDTKQVTMYKAFQFVLQSIFQYNKQLNKLMDQNQRSFQIKSKNDFLKAFRVQNPQVKTIDFAIGQKLSNKIDIFSDEQIRTGDIKIRNTAVLRVITKWAEQLRQVLRQPYQKFMVNNKFISKTGQTLIFTKQIRRVMLQVVQEQQQRIKEVFKDIQQIYLKNQQEIFQFQATQFYLNQYDTNIGVIAGRTQICIGRYMLIYLNQVIHSLMSIPIKTVQKLHKGTQFRLGQKDRIKILSLNLVTCKLSDLLRGKCKTNQQQIISIYKLIEKHSLKNPKILKLIKVKDRLNTPNKDISLNFMFMNKVVCELQLVTSASQAAAKDKKSSFYNNFNHLLYELQRAQFGPIAESAYIAAKYDPLINKNAKKIQDYELSNYKKSPVPKQKTVIEPQNKPTNRQQSNLVTPYICQTCKRLIQADNYSYIPKNKNKYCNQCTMDAISQKSFSIFLSVLLRRRSYSQRDLNILENTFILMNPSKIKSIQDVYIGYLIQKNTDSPNPLFFRSLQIDGQLHFLSSQIREQKKNIPLLTFPLRDKGARKKAIVKLKQYYLLTLKKQYVKPKPQTKQLFHEKLSQDVQIFCYCKENQSCVLNYLANQIFPVQAFREIINKKVFKSKIDKQQKRVYLQQRKLDEKQVEKFNINNSALQVEADKNMFTSLKLIENFTQIRRVLLDDNNIKTLQGINETLNLQQLSVNKNLLQNLDGIQNFPNLKILNASTNKIKQIPSFQKNPLLQKLSIDKNQIQKLIFTQKLQYLTYLSCLPDKSSPQQIRINYVEIGQNLPKLQYLNIQFSQQINLNWISRQKCLKSIYMIQSQKAITQRSFGYIGQCEALERMQINKCDIRTLQPIKNLSKLTFLDISKNKLENLDGIIGLQSLVNIQCSDNLLTDFPKPDNFKNLKFLYINRNKLKNTNFLEFMPNLQCFEANENGQIKETESQDFQISLKLFGWMFSAFITKKTYCLRQLQLGKNIIESLIFIKRYRQMTDFQCRFNKLNRFQSYLQNVNLTNLDLQFNQIETFVINVPMPNLKKIDLHQNKIQKLQFYENMEFLQSLSISNNMLQDLNGIERCPNLEILNCNENKISSLNTKSHDNNNSKNKKSIYKSLKKLFINNNKLKNLKEINSFYNLQELHCKNNQLVSLEIDSKMKKLEILDIQMNRGLKSIKELNYLITLKKVFCCDNKIEELFNNHPNIEQLQVDIKNIDQINNIKSMKKLRKLGIHCNTIIAKEVKAELDKSLAKRIQIKLSDYITVPPPNQKKCVTCQVQFSKNQEDPNYFYFWRYWHADKDLQCSQCYKKQNNFNKAIYLNSNFQGQFNSKLLGRDTTAKIRQVELKQQSSIENLFPYYICGFCKKQCNKIRYICLIEGQGQKGFADFCGECVNSKTKQDYQQLSNGHKIDHPLLVIRHNYFYKYDRFTGYFYY